MIEVRDLCYKYARSPVNVLKGINLDLHESSMTAIMGANGSGKSTLARCLNGLLTPASGRVRVDGLDTGDRARINDIRRRVGIIFQNPNEQITSVTVERELAFGLENIGMDVAEMHRRVEIHLDSFGLAKYRQLSPSRLSGGEKQRLAIASVLMLEPRYLILDEATSLLSVAFRRRVLEMVMQSGARRNMGVILITQFPAEALLAGRLVVLHDGCIMHDGPPGEVFGHEDELSSYGVPLPIMSLLERRYASASRLH